MSNWDVGLGPEERRRYPAVRERAEVIWPTASSDTQPFVEVYFEPCRPDAIEIPASMMGYLIPAECVPTRLDPFPFPSFTQEPVGLVSRLPADAAQPPKFMWLLGHGVDFLDRQALWEDDPMSVVKGGVSLPTLAERLVLLVTFLDRLTRRLGWDEALEFRLGVRLSKVKGRYLARYLDGRRSRTDHHRTDRDEIHAQRSHNLARLRPPRFDMVAGLIVDAENEFGWDPHMATISAGLEIIASARKELGLAE